MLSDSLHIPGLVHRGTRNIDAMLPDSPQIRHLIDSGSLLTGNLPSGLQDLVTKHHFERPEDFDGSPDRLSMLSDVGV